MTLEGIRQEIGARLRPHSAPLGRSLRGQEHVDSAFIGLSERVCGEQLDDLFEAWLYTAGKPSLS